MSPPCRVVPHERKESPHTEPTRAFATQWRAAGAVIALSGPLLWGSPPVRRARDRECAQSGHRGERARRRNRWARRADTPAPSAIER